MIKSEFLDILLIIATVILCVVIWPMNFLRPYTYTSEPGELQFEETGIIHNNQVLRQSFFAEYEYLDNISLCLRDLTIDQEGTLNIAIQDSNGKEMCDRQIQLSEINFFEFSRIDINCDISRGKEYTICVSVSCNDEEGVSLFTQPQNLCLNEFDNLTLDEKVIDGGLYSMIEYSYGIGSLRDAIPYWVCVLSVMIIVRILVDAMLNFFRGRRRNGSKEI